MPFLDSFRLPLCSLIAYLLKADSRPTVDTFVVGHLINLLLQTQLGESVERVRWSREIMCVYNLNSWPTRSGNSDVTTGPDSGNGISFALKS